MAVSQPTSRARLLRTAALNQCSRSFLKSGASPSVWSAAGHKNDPRRSMFPCGEDHPSNRCIDFQRSVGVWRVSVVSKPAGHRARPTGCCLPSGPRLCSSCSGSSAHVALHPTLFLTRFSGNLPSELCSSHRLRFYALLFSQSVYLAKRTFSAAVEEVFRPTYRDCSGCRL